MAIDKIQSESINLADNFAFTGTVTGAGESNKPYFKASNNANWSFSSSSTTKMRMNLVAFESNAGSFNTSNYNFTVPSGEGGKYFINYSLYLNASTNALAAAYIFVNNVERLWNDQTNQDDYSGSVFLSAAGIVNVSAGDTIDCRCYYNSGSPELIGNTYTDGRFSYFEGFKLTAS
jgi:hypothetical protein